MVISTREKNLTRKGMVKGGGKVNRVVVGESH